MAAARSRDRRRRPRRRLKPVRRRITANFLKALLLVAFLAALAGGLGWLIGGQRSAALFAFCALSAAIAVYWLGDRALLGMLDARPFALAEDPLLRSATDRLAAQLQVVPPKLCLIDDGFPRAFVVGRGPGGATLVVSTGLLRVARREELDAIIAHELAHIRSLDVLTQMFAVLLATTLMETSRLGGFLSRALLFVLGPIACRVHARAAVAPPRVQRRPGRGGRLRPARRGRGAAAARPCLGARVVRGTARDGAALHDRPVRDRPAVADVPHASAARGAGAPPAGTRSEPERAGRARPGAVATQRQGEPGIGSRTQRGPHSRVALSRN